MQMLFLAGAIGLLSGVASGLFGVGGGIVMVPAMILLMKIDPKVAVGTSLLVIIPTAISGSLKHYDLKQINFKLAFALMPMAIVGSFFGAWMTKHLTSLDLKRAFGAFLIVVGVKLLIGK